MEKRITSYTYTLATHSLEIEKHFYSRQTTISAIYLIFIKFIKTFIRVSIKLRKNKFIINVAGVQVYNWGNLEEISV
jgi:hypothetical protein